MERMTAAALRVLVVDPCPDTRGILARLLRLWGFHARTARNDSHALQVAADWRPSAVLLDLDLESSSSVALPRRLRAAPTTADAFLAAVTHAPSDEGWRQVKAAGCDLQLTKPIEPATLRRLLEAFQTAPR
jgi:CheY-like chemotaxis protein